MDDLCIEEGVERTAGQLCRNWGNSSCLTSSVIHLISRNLLIPFGFQFEGLCFDSKFLKNISSGFSVLLADISVFLWEKFHF